MIRGSKLIPRSVQLTKCALRHASVETTHRGSFSKVAVRASRLICRRKTYVAGAVEPGQVKRDLDDVDADHGQVLETC